MEIEPLLHGLVALRDRAATGELAYLCLSGKSENHLRDLVAFEIARAQPTWMVRREVGRVDLTIRDEIDDGIDVEFKVGYACVVATSGENSRVIRSAILDFQKRNQLIVSCIGLMHFEGTGSPNLEGFRNPTVLRRASGNPAAPFESRGALKRIWPDRRIEFVEVGCGCWKDVAVSIDFAVLNQGPTGGQRVKLS